MNFNIIPSTPISSELSLTFCLVQPNFVRVVHLPMRVTCPAHVFRLIDDPNNMWRRVKMMELLIMYCYLQSICIRNECLVDDHLLLSDLAA